MNNNDNTFLSVKDLVVEYTSNRQIVHAVNGVSLDIGRGRTLGLVGETGAGKTTIARAIIGILQMPPASIKGGEIIFEGEDLLKKSQEEMQKIRGDQIAMIFQDPMTALNPLMNVGDQIAEMVRIHNPHLSRKQLEERAMEMLEMVGIPKERYIEYPFQFSGGMKQRVVIAIALACNPKLLLADEPTTALDVTIQAQILNIIKDLQKKQNASLLLITHDLGVVAETCDDVAVIYAGQIIEYGSKERIFLNPTHPYTLGLFGSLPIMNKGKDRLQPIKGMMRSPLLPIEGCPFYERCSEATQQCRTTNVEMKEIAPGHFCRCLNKEKEGEEWII